MEKPQQDQVPKTAKALSARLHAVQALYQMMQNGEATAAQVLDQYLDDARKGVEIDGEELVQPDGALFKAIFLGAQGRSEELGEVISANFQKGKEGKNTQIEPLLKAILLAASYELLAHNEIDAPIIINDYLNVTHGFYEQGEVNLVNGVLDSVGKALRD